jgi:hypothetical protein
VYYQFECWRNDPAIIHGVFTRKGGTSAAPWASLNLGGTVGDDPLAVRHNVELAHQSLGLDANQARTVWQVHSADAVLADVGDGCPPGRRWLARADAMVTNRPGIPLTMRFADCVPILLVDPVRGAIGMAHAGWRGTVAQVAVSAIRLMQTAYGTDPADIQAAIGPSIGPDHYQVGPEVVEAVERAFGSGGPCDWLIRRADDGSAYLNLWEANRLALERAGVRHVEVAGICTATHVDEFYSHRAERGRTGRFGAILALKE